MKYKGCPRCGKTMPLEVKGQCEECKKGRYKAVNTLPGIKRSKAQAVYDTNQWKRVRAAAIKRAHGLCEVCRAKGKLTPGLEVHHIIKVINGNGSTNYNLDNLVYVCKSCHSKIEGMNEMDLLKFLG